MAHYWAYGLALYAAVRGRAKVLAKLHNLRMLGRGKPRRLQNRLKTSKLPLAVQSRGSAKHSSFGNAEGGSTRRLSPG